MLPDKSDLLEQINTAIKRNSCKKSTEQKGYSARINAVEITGELIDKNFFSYNRTFESIKKLEHRIEELENQNDLLLYFIHFLYKNFPDLVRDILPNDNHAINGKNLMGKSAESLLVVKSDSPSLTRREIEILHLLVKGLCAKEIANMLFISETTVITHKKNLKEKFNAKNSVELISKAFTILIKTG